MSKATTSAERAVAGTLEDLPARVEAARLEAPALVVVGQVVAVRERIESLRAEAPAPAPARERLSAARLLAGLRRRLARAAA